MKKKLKWPNFKNEDKVKNWVNKTDFSEYLHQSDLKSVSFPNLKPSKKLVSLRLEESLVEKAKQKAAKLHIPYQTLLRKILHDGLETA
jgi:predicted DNA binding CopG/RHH family protein